MGARPIVAGIIVAAGALEEIALHPRDAVPLGAQAGERLVGALVIAGIVFVGGSLEGLVLLTTVVAVMFVVLIIEHRRVERLRSHAELDG